MSDGQRETARARSEAASWFTRLSRRSVTTQAIRDFREWRREPSNRAAYEQVETVWDRAGSLSEDPEIAALRQATLAGAGQSKMKSRRRAGWALAATAALACGMLVFVAYRLAPPSYESGIGEQRIVRLADGSTLRLNTDSLLVVKFRNDQRIIDLKRGQALFDVAHDPARPFVVRADGASVRALGTIFDVRLAGDDVDVTLIEGAVKVLGASGRQLTLKPNQRVQVHEGILATPASTDARRVTSWTERRLTFESTPLAAAIADVNRYSKLRIELETADLAGAPVNGVFEAGDSRAFAAAVSSVFDLQLIEHGDGRIVLKRAPTAAS